MSEYQYYEFLAVDRPLTAEEQRQVGSLSSRTHPTPTHAVFTYSYSDFRGDPIEVLAAYYDAMLYMANWGSRRLAFRLPRSIVHPDRLAPYCIGDLISTAAHGDHVVLDLNFYEIEADAPEPPVPAGLGDLSAPLRAFVDFFDIDDDQLAVAAEASPRAEPTA